MQKYFITECDFLNKVITSSDVHHIKNVMRMKIGNEILIGYNKFTYLCEITSIEDNIGFKIIKNIEDSTEMPLDVTLIMGLVKKDKLDFIVKKTTELGISHIIPVQMQRSIAKISDNENLKLERFKKIAKEASEQSKRSIVPTISKTLQSLENIDFSSYDLKIVCSFKDYKKQEQYLKEKLKENIKTICFLVGPEGGISQEELSYLIKNGFIEFSLGPRVLRCETAPICFLSMLSLIIEMSE